MTASARPRPEVVAHATPNPASTKFTAAGHRFTPAGMHSFASPREAVGNSLAEALFAIPAVDNVLILPDFVTVSLANPSEWSQYLEAIRATLADFAEEVD